MSFNRLNIIKNLIRLMMRSGENPYAIVDVDKFTEDYFQTNEPIGDRPITLYFMLKGTEDTPWEDIEYKCKLVFDKNYPIRPPKAYFCTKIHHPNVYSSGDVCISILHEGENQYDSTERGMTWTPQQSIESVILSIHALFEDPNCGSPANVDAKKLYQSDRVELRRKNLSCAS